MCGQSRCPARPMVRLRRFFGFFWRIHRARNWEVFAPSTFFIRSVFTFILCHVIKCDRKVFKIRTLYLLLLQPFTSDNWQSCLEGRMKIVKVKSCNDVFMDKNLYCINQSMKWFIPYSLQRQIRKHLLDLYGCHYNKYPPIRHAYHLHKLEPTGCESSRVASF